MCVNFKPITSSDCIDYFDVIMPDSAWPDECFQDYMAPIILNAEAKRKGVLASYGMIPKKHLSEGKKHFSTMNARSETLHQLPSFKEAWHKKQFCLVPMYSFYEPNWESGHSVRWNIHLASQSPFAVAGLWRAWPSQNKDEDVQASLSFTQITINADHHPLMKQFHRPEDEKRMLVIVPPEHYDDWLNCPSDALARKLFQPYPAEWLDAKAAPIKRKRKEVPQLSLFE